MSDGALSAGSTLPRLPGWAGAAVLLIATGLIGGMFGATIRPLFVLGCGVVGWLAWRQGPGAHLQAVLMLFAFSPFVRRIVDLSVGYDTSGVMLVGPLIALLVTAPRLLRLLDPARPRHQQIVPLLLVGACVVYAAALSMIQGDWTNAASGSIKWIAPIVYALALVEVSDRDEMIRAATSAFLVILPIIGLYGIYQYVNPPDWDRYWVSFAPILSIGQALPYSLRTFATMNSPASFATFTAIGLLLLCFARANWQSLLLASPATVALMLSQYRTAWISLAVGVVFCMLFARTRLRATGLVVGITVVVALAALLTPFGEIIGERLATFSEGAQDGSAQERLDQFVALWNLPDSSLFGVGFTFSDVGTAGAMAVDGMIISCWLTMGIVVGSICLLALGWAISNAVAVALRERSREAILIGALAIGALVQLPLASLTSGENGFLFWTFVVLTTTPRAVTQRLQSRTSE